MSDDVISYAGVDFGGDDAAIEEFILAPVGPEADDARGPGSSEAGDLE